MFQHREQDNQSRVEDMILNAIRNYHCKKIQDVVERLQNIDKSLSPTEIFEGIQNLEEKKKISLMEPQAQKSFGNYLTKNSASLPFWLTVSIVTLIFVTTYLTPQIEPLSLVKVVVGSMFILFIPGYTLVQLIFPQREMNYIERIILSICISLGIIPLVGLILYSISAGITTSSIILSISVLVVPMTLVSQYRTFSFTNRTLQRIIA